jgi:hypothetical protein
MSWAEARFPMIQRYVGAGNVQVRELLVRRRILKNVVVMRPIKARMEAHGMPVVLVGLGCTDCRRKLESWNRAFEVDILY